MSALERRFGLAGQVVLITGATGGIGGAMVDAFAEAGAKLVLASHDDADCRQAAARAIELGTEALAVTTDVRSEAELDRLVEAAMEQHGRIDALICNAGIAGPFGPMHEASKAECDEAFAVNLHALPLTSRVAPLMAEKEGGSIVLTSSIAGLRGNARIGPYGLTKAALNQLARNLAVEWGPSNVRANAIAPGLIRTGWADAILASDEASAKRMQLTPLRRIGESEEVAATALFLCTPGAAFITGQVIAVDGGTTITDGN